MGLYWGFPSTWRERDIGGASKKILNAQLTLASGDPESDLTTAKTAIKDAVTSVRLEKCHDSKSAKILFAINEWDQRSPEAPGFATARGGAIPAGWFEEGLSTWLEALAT